MQMRTMFHLLAGQRAPQVALVVKNSPANAGYSQDAGLIPGLGRSPGESHGNQLQNSCLETLMNRAWPATFYRITKNRTLLK